MAGREVGDDARQAAPLTGSLRKQLQTLLGSSYTLDNELGGGGMSRVFTATEASLGRRVVIKVLPPEVAAGVKVERFKREIQFMARLNHPHIVPMLAAGGKGGLSYYVMPFMQGESLRARILQHGELPLAEVVRTLREVASALSFAHSNSIIHRDIKPDNVLLTGGSAMVTDFGVAKALSVSTGDGDPNSLTSLGITLGTPSYMAPEQATADPKMDHRADIYSFGAMAYEMLTGRPVFAARSPQGMLSAHISEEPVPVIERRPGIPPLLDSLVMSCLEKSPANRPQTAEEIVHVLDDIVMPREEPDAVSGDEDGQNRPFSSGAMRLLQRRTTRSHADEGNRYLLVTVIVLLVALVMIAGIWLGLR